MDLNWYLQQIASAQQRQGPQPQTKQQIADAARATQTFALPAMADPNWKPATTESVLGADYKPPEGGPTVDQLNASPVWQAVLSQIAGAPSTIPNSKDMPALIQNLLSGFQSLEGGYYGEPPAWATTTAPTPGQAGWVNPQWATGALPGGVAPPKPSTNDMGHYFPDASGSTWEPFQFGQANAPNSWLGQAQQSFPQGPPSAPVVNPWSYQQQRQPQQRGPGMSGADPKTSPWGFKPWYS